MNSSTHGLKAAALACLVVPLMLAGTAAQAQWKCTGTRTDCIAKHEAESVVQTHYLHNIASQQDANEVLVTLRNMLEPSVKIYLVSNQEAIVLDAPPEEQKLADQLIDELTKPHKTCRLTFTIVPVEDNKQLPAKTVSLDVAVGERSTYKQGSRIPVATGTYNAGTGSSPKTGTETQFTYLDVGVAIDATLLPMNGDSFMLKAKVEQSTANGTSSIAGVAEPVIQQATLEGFALLTPGKSVKLGSVTVPGTSERAEISVVAEPQP